MHAVFLSLAVVLLFSRPADAGVQVVRLPNEIDIASHVFVGPHEELALDGSYYLSIQPTQDASGSFAVPKDVIGAIKELRQALPTWFLNALRRTKGDRTCTFIVNEGDNKEMDYVSLLEAWYWINWHMDADRSPLRVALGHHGLHRKWVIVAAIRFGFCAYLNSGSETEALSIVRSYSKLDRD